jgi:hypothetical protein
LEDKEKNHELASIDDGYELEINNLGAQESHLLQEQESVASLEQQLEAHTKAIQSRTEEKIDLVTEFFAVLRSLVDKKEKEMVSNYQGSAEAEAKKISFIKAGLLQKQLSIQESLNFTKEVVQIKDRYTVLVQVKAFQKIIEDGLKAMKPERLVVAVKDFKMDLELKALTNEMAEATKPGKIKPQKHKKATGDVFNRSVDHPLLQNKGEVQSINLKQEKDIKVSPTKEITTVKVMPILIDNKTSHGNASDKPKPISQNLLNLSKEPNKIVESTKDFQAAKPKTPQMNSTKDKKKENIPPKAANQPSAQLTGSNLMEKEKVGSKQAAKTNLSNSGKREEKEIPKTKPIGTPKGFNLEDQNKKSFRDNIPKSKEMPLPKQQSKEQADKGGMSLTAAEGIEIKAGKECKVQKKTTDLEKARALKKAQQKKEHQDKSITPKKNKEESGEFDSPHLEKSKGKSLNKKILVDNDHISTISDNQSLRLTNFKFSDVNTSVPPSIVLIGGYGSDPETELPIVKFQYGKSIFTSIGKTCCLVKSACVRTGDGRVLMIGGKSKGQRLNVINEINPLTGEMAELGVSLTKAKSGCGAVFINGNPGLILRPSVCGRRELRGVYPG